LRGISTKDRLLLSTGRVSSEMLLKAARMQVPVVVSRHSPTGSAVALAVTWALLLLPLRAVAACWSARTRSALAAQPVRRRKFGSNLESTGTYNPMRW